MGGTMTQDQHQSPTWTPDGALLPYPGHTPPPRKRPWLPHLLIILGAVAILGVAVLALNWPASSSATHTVVYTAEADAAYGSGRTGMVTIQSPGGGTSQTTGVLPFTSTLTFGTGDFVYLSVQNQQGAGSVTCRITVDGTVVSENTSSGGFTIASCQGRVPGK